MAAPSREGGLVDIVIQSSWEDAVDRPSKRGRGNGRS